MFIADNWKDYEVIDTSKGEKLERWGKYILVRPDPQVIWDTPKKERGWKNMNGHYHRSSKGGGEWEFFDLPQQWQIHYNSPSFEQELTFFFLFSTIFLSPYRNQHFCFTKFSLKRILLFAPTNILPHLNKINVKMYCYR